MIYLDHAATTQCSEEVLAAMLPYFREHFANASSIDHKLGSQAREAVEFAREKVAALVGSKPEDVIFTSGSTEANNLVLSVDMPVLTTRVEHPSILDAFDGRSNPSDRYIDLDQEGIVNVKDLEAAMRTERRLVSLIATNNETGIEQDLDLIASVAGHVDSLLHVDATQAVGTRDVRMGQRNIAGASVSAHKIQGPKGIGALIASGALRRCLRPLIRGGGHERGLRSGTLNVPGIVGFGAAAELALRHRAQRRHHLAKLRGRFLEVITDRFPRAHETIPGAATSPHILSLRLEGTNGRALLRAVRDQVAFSLGSACATNKSEPSHVLVALGIEKKAISETIRCSFSSEQTVDEIEKAATAIGVAATALSAYSLSA